VPSVGRIFGKLEDGLAAIAAPGQVPRPNSAATVRPSRAIQAS
jgi:hypothetical protein